MKKCPFPEVTKQTDIQNQRWKETQKERLCLTECSLLHCSEGRLQERDKLTTKSRGCLSARREKEVGIIKKKSLLWLPPLTNSNETGRGGAAYLKTKGNLGL